jgi:hypothetical protein
VQATAKKDRGDSAARVVLAARSIGGWKRVRLWKYTKQEQYQFNIRKEIW